MHEVLIGSIKKAHRESGGGLFVGGVETENQLKGV